MGTGWSIVIVVAVLAAGVFVRGMVRGAVTHARVQVRRDLFALASAQAFAAALAQGAKGPAVALAPPAMEGRESTFGWLWWRATMRPDGEIDYARGWAWTYRRARKAAGMPLGWRDASFEVVTAPGRSASAGPAGEDS